jgi:CCR4-NOT transcription complex subunit 3
VQDEDFNEYEGIYDELNLEEEESKFGLVNEEDEDSDESDAASDGMYFIAILFVGGN